MYDNSACSNTPCNARGARMDRSFDPGWPDSIMNVLQCDKDTSANRN